MTKYEVYLKIKELGADSHFTEKLIEGICTDDDFIDDKVVDILLKCHKLSGGAEDTNLLYTTLPLMVYNELSKITNITKGDKE